MREKGLRRNPGIGLGYSATPEEKRMISMPCMQLEQLGVFHKVKGIVIGHICNEAAENRTVQMADVVERVTANMVCPYLRSMISAIIAPILFYR
jgi:preprotein translocase subunit SecB